MIAGSWGVTPRAAQDLVRELGLREANGSRALRAWGVLYSEPCLERRLPPQFVADWAGELEAALCPAETPTRRRETCPFRGLEGP